MLKFYKCPQCGNIVTLLYEEKGKLVCCGEKMKELIPGTVDAAKEKHIPEVEVEGSLVKVTVGEVIHPMIEVHYITFILIETTKGHQIKYLQPNEKPYAEFVLAEGEELVAAYEYCNLHGLWKKEVK